VALAERAADVVAGTPGDRANVPLAVRQRDALRAETRTSLHGLRRELGARPADVDPN
jgi:hypothetical protein